jgi:hypothetical protein
VSSYPRTGSGIFFMSTFSAFSRIAVVCFQMNQSLLQDDNLVGVGGDLKKISESFGS